jgi:transposase
MSISEHKHMPEPVRRMEVFTGAGRRRSWSAAEKAAIIAESYSAGDTVCSVARRHGLTPQQLFTWRRLARQPALSPVTMFVPAVVDRVEPEPTVLIKAPRRVRRRAHVDGIELEIAGVEVRIGSRLCGNGLRLWSQPIPHSAPLL